MDKLLERFLNYVSLDTQSKAGVRQVPSTEGQWKLLHLLKEQLEEMGLINVTLSEKGTLMATLPANVPGDIPAIGFISHVDTSPDCSGKNVNPQIVENYRGGDIALGIGDEVLSPVMFPVLHQLLGQTLESVVELENGKMVMVSEFFNEDDPDFDHSLDQKMAINWVESWEVVLADEEHK